MALELQGHRNCHVVLYPLKKLRESENTTRLLNQTQSYVYEYIQCIIQSHNKKHDYLLALLILDIQVLEEKEKRGQ